MNLLRIKQAGIAFEQIVHTAVTMQIGYLTSIDTGKTPFANYLLFPIAYLEAWKVPLFCSN